MTPDQRSGANGLEQALAQNVPPELTQWLAQVTAAIATGRIVSAVAIVVPVGGNPDIISAVATGTAPHVYMGLGSMQRMLEASAMGPKILRARP